ncbi:MAG: methionyl-tRNA formyltransferase [Candidatus Sungbacteria bacterium]|nr:methionyl-tRNA formyltransferase [Candidatus Sungbacteria bacterium]
MQNIKQIKIIFIGTPQFAVPALEALLQAGLNVVGVVTRPDEPVGREQIITPPPVKVAAKKYAIPVFQPETLAIESWAAELPSADCFVVAAYGKLIPASVVELPRFGAINIHPSLLPHLRGPSPIQYAILRGEAETGVSIMQIDKLLDHGPIFAQTIISLREKIGYKALHDVLATEGARLLVETLPKIFSGALSSIPQNDDQATYSKILKKDDGRVNWTRPAEEIERMVRAFEQWPGSWTLWPTEKQIYRIRIEEASISENEPPHGSPGHVWQEQGVSYPFVKTGRGSLVIKKLTAGGKKAVDAREFLRGYPQFIGTTLI